MLHDVKHVSVVSSHVCNFAEDQGCSCAVNSNKTAWKCQESRVIGGREGAGEGSFHRLKAEKKRTSAKRHGFQHAFLLEAHKSGRGRRREGASVACEASVSRRQNTIRVLTARELGQAQIFALAPFRTRSKLMEYPYLSM